MRTNLLLIGFLVCFTNTVYAGGFYGGVADGMERYDERELQREALKVSPNAYEQVTTEIKLRRLERQLKEANERLDEIKRNQGR